MTLYWRRFTSLEHGETHQLAIITLFSPNVNLSIIKELVQTSTQLLLCCTESFMTKQGPTKQDTPIKFPTVLFFTGIFPTPPLSGGLWVPGFEPRPAGSHTEHLANCACKRKRRQSSFSLVETLIVELEQQIKPHCITIGPKWSSKCPWPGNRIA
jgi:hypothetical protein